jgi:hypothetical protein
MAKKQTRRSISVSRTTYERLKAFCETNNISMSQLVETRVNDFLGTGEVAPAMQSVPFRPVAPRPVMVPPTRPVEARPVVSSPSPGSTSALASAPVSAPTPTPTPTPAAGPVVPMTSAAARFVIEPPPPIIKPRQDTAAPKPAEKRPEQIFTF